VPSSITWHVSAFSPGWLLTISAELEPLMQARSQSHACICDDDSWKGLAKT
jgi:hypothetical protein